MRACMAMLPYSMTWVAQKLTEYMVTLPRMALCRFPKIARQHAYRATHLNRIIARSDLVDYAHRLSTNGPAYCRRPNFGESANDFTTLCEVAFTFQCHRSLATMTIIQKHKVKIMAAAV